MLAPVGNQATVSKSEARGRMGLDAEIVQGGVQPTFLNGKQKGVIKNVLPQPQG